jgi:phosphopentomutase
VHLVSSGSHGKRLDRLTQVGREVVSIGKIGDIYAHSGTGTEIKAVGNDALFEALHQEASAGATASPILARRSPGIRGRATRIGQGLAGLAFSW